MKKSYIFYIGVSPLVSQIITALSIPVHAIKLVSDKLYLALIKEFLTSMPFKFIKGELIFI